MCNTPDVLRKKKGLFGSISKPINCRGINRLDWICLYHILYHIFSIDSDADIRDRRFGTEMEQIWDENKTNRIWLGQKTIQLKII
jgi:hypothetical protein